MKEIFNKTTMSIILSSIISFILGLILVINPGLTLKTIGVVVGIYIIIHGLVLLVLDFKVSRLYIPFDGIMSGILSIILGIVLIALPGLLSAIFALAIGVWIILSSVNIIKMAIAVKNQTSNWFLLLLFGILDLIAGIIVIFNPFESSMSITMFVGIIIMIHSVINIVDMIVIKKNVKDVTKAIENAIKKI